jgi:hypothetical protein
MLTNQLQPENFLKAILAGNATITIKNSLTNNRFTYKISKGVANPDMYHVSLLNGPDNETSYIFIGSIINKKYYSHSKNSKISNNIPSVLGFSWVINKLVNNQLLPTNVQLWHEGTCCKCGRKLTVPESINSGFGPECSKMMNI